MMLPPVFNCGEDIFMVCSIGFLPHTVFCLMANTFCFVLVGSELLLSRVRCIPYISSGKLQTEHKLYSYLSSIKARYVECTSNSCLVNKFSHLSCGSLQLLRRSIFK
ncbi:hypothetical protein ATANTOWER_006025 [Ataeniobius toweri]|uniref:Uncharacterized protein n=1 Tax=Ataeniobius toweri TaxID=208326 RepID=A0ABU7B1V5_9TELE|nr:hypothetical protein [Ataeniobius toweri]